ncbi:hypothetical protein ACGF3C_20205 [Micromonospora sp. NPDC047762]|uniref:hypothetical protein n=1 Tax=Micromonospora sp. NPDC047762 TaxID=3364255 RepID=UPI003712CEB0
MPSKPSSSFGLMTAPMQVDYHDILRVWQEADAIAEIEHALLDRYCAAIGRDPASITRSINLPVSYDQPRLTRDAVGRAIGAGIGHIVLTLPAPYPAGVARWVADELIIP